MRKWINLFENDDAGEERAFALIHKYGGKPVPFDALPPAAKRSVEHYMTVDGENDEFEEYQYAYAEIPTEEFMHAYWDNIETTYGEGEELGTASGYKSAEEMIASYRKDKLGGTQYANHDLVYPWPVFLGTDFFEDGAHRLHLYVSRGLEKIPAVMVVHSN